MMQSQPMLQGAQLRSHIEKKPYTQKMNDIDYTYSIIPKKQKSFVFTHVRFLLLKSIESISYARQFPSNAPLPFRSPADLPKPKMSYPLASIEHCSTEQQKLIIEFNDSEKTRWQFFCPSKGCAHEWRKKIEMALNELTKFNMSKMDKYDDYLAKKRRDDDADRLRKQRDIDRLNNPPPPPPQQQAPPSPVSQLRSSNVGLINKAVDILIKPSEPGQFRTPPREEPKIVQKQPQASDVKAISDMLIDVPSRPVPILTKSASTLSMTSKQSIRGEIASYRRNWLDEFIAHKQQTQLLLDFKSYISKIVEVVISQLHIPQDSKIFQYREWSKDHASYVIDDIYVQIYFYSRQQLQKKHHRQRHAAKQFKNYDYLLESTKNEGILLAPFMVMFEFKGFTGMAKTVLGNQTLPHANKQCLSEINLDQFREEARIEPRLLADQNKCKIVSYQPQRLMLNQQKIGRVFFIERFAEFLPSEISESLQQKRLLRPELVQDPSLEEYVFGDRQKQAGPFEIESLIDKKIREFIVACEHQQDYFTSSKELSELMHSFGLNLRHLGQILPLVQQQWLKKILQTELAARCLKNFFRFDMQNCVLNQTERIDLKQKQSEFQKKRAISFLNIVLGNTEPSFHLWRSLNHYSRSHFKTTLWQQRYQDINIGYFLQALQNHLKITLSDQIHKRTFFKSGASLSQTDFIRFNADINIYNLDFTITFEKIYECLDDKSAESFGELSKMMTRETNNGKPYLFMLKDHPIYDKICEYFLYFITPEEYHQFYTTLDEINLPSRFFFQCHLTQIKWFIKNKPQFIIKPVKLIMNSARKWLGQFHPIFVKMNHTLAQYYMDNPYFYSKAISHATESLELQHQLSKGEPAWLWKDYFLIGKIHFVNNNFQNSLPPLEKAKSLVALEHLKSYESYAEMVLALCKCYFALNNYREAYILVRELYGLLREQPDEDILEYLIECVTLIRSLLQKNHQFQAYYKFVETDFCHTLINAIGNSTILAKSIKLIVVPYLKYIIHQKIGVRGQIFNLIEELYKVPITYLSCQSFLEINIKKGKFPQQFFETLRDIERVIEEIYSNNMIERWVSFNRMSNQTLMERIGGSELSREFEFLAEFTSILGLLGDDAKREFVFMEK